MSEKNVKKFDLANPGDYIRKRREELELSQDVLAALTNISSPHLSDIENGKKNPSLFLLKKIFNVLNVDFELKEKPKLKPGIQKMIRNYSLELEKYKSAMKKLRFFKDRFID